MILGIEGSPRKRGNSHLVLGAVLSGVHEAGVAHQAVHLRDLSFAPCSGCEACRKDGTCSGLQDDMTPLYPLIEQARGMVLVSPVHNYNVTAWMKGFIDRLYCYYDFKDTRPRAWSSRLAGQGRRAVLCVIGEQDTAGDMGVAMEALRLPFTALGYEIVEELVLMNLFDRGAVARRSDLLDQARAAGRSLARSL